MDNSVREPIIEQCRGCERIVSDGVSQNCVRYLQTTVQWRRGNCIGATHIKKETTLKGKLNPMKASKRGGR